ncbi:MAG: helix-turn-helix domain-containing protein [Rhizomicrobium sp.]
MKIPAPDFRLLRFSTAHFAPAARIAAWREVLAIKLLALDVEALGDKPFAADVMLRSLHDVRIATGRIAPAVSRRSAALVAADNDDMAMLIVLDGTIVVTQDGSVTLKAGDGVLFICSRELVLTNTAAVRVLFLRIPYATLARCGSPRDLAPIRLVPRGTSNLHLLVRYAGTLFEDDDIAMTPGAGLVVIEHVVDLAALAIGAARETRMPGEARDDAARLRNIKADILRNLTWRDLSLAWFATRHGLSTRRLYRMFERDGASFAEFVLEQRLAAAHRMILNRRFADHSISAIALQCGFGDISYFNRSFRAKYGETPSGVRAADEPADAPE